MLREASVPPVSFQAFKKISSILMRLTRTWLSFKNYFLGFIHLCSDSRWYCTLQSES